MRIVRTRRIPLAAAIAAVLLVVVAPSAGSAPATPPAPGNDDASSAQQIHSLPATLSGTLVGATLEPQEEGSGCAASTDHSVWYSIRAGAKERIAVNLAAAGALDATVDVFHAVRSELGRVACERTDSHGAASLSFTASKNGLYEVRVAALPASQLAGFTLEVFLPTPAVNPPGPRLAAGGAAGHVDRIQNINAAYSVVMRSGVSYLVNLANKTPHACVSAALFGPGTRSFEEGGAVLHLRCGGFGLYTPGPGQGGVYSIELTPRSSFKTVQRFRLQVAVAGPAETAPGIALGNYGRARGRLDGDGVHVLRLYRIDVHTHSNLTLRLRAPLSADFNLQLRNINGNVIECACGGSGSQTLARQLRPGRYYAVVSVHDATAGNYTLLRESRTITQTHLSFGTAKAGPGQSVGVQVRVSPSVSGPVTVDVERFDPAFGWQFYRRENGFASGGLATLPFAPPAVGRWRVHGRFGGTRTASPSGAGFAYLLVS